MKAIFKFAILMATIHLLLGCGSDYVRSNDKLAAVVRNVAKFNQLRITGPYKILVTFGQPNRITVVTASNIEPLIVTRVENGVLEIHHKPGYILYTHRPIVIKIEAESLQGITVGGSVLLNARGVQGESFNLKAMGMARVNLAGQVERATISATGASQVFADKLKSNELIVEAKGLATAYVYVLNKLQTTISGSGRVFYQGNPSSIVHNVSEDGRLEKKVKLYDKQH